MIVEPSKEPSKGQREAWIRNFAVFRLRGMVQSLINIEYELSRLERLEGWQSTEVGEVLRDCRNRMCSVLDKLRAYEVEYQERRKDGKKKKQET